MAASLVCILLVGITVIASVLGTPAPRNEDILPAVRDMQDAKYFTFVTLVNMVQDEITNNTTLLVPSDQLLSNITIPEHKVMEFVARHSIPSALHLDQLLLLPTGTMLPTNQQDNMVKVFNEGRETFMLNNARVVSPDICASNSVTCHGIDAILGEFAERENSHTGENPAHGPAPSFRSGSVNLSLGKLFSTISCVFLYLF